MWIKLRNVDGSAITTLDLSKLTKIEKLRARLVKLTGVGAERQRLFFRGKQLEDGHTLFDYAVNVNDIVQVLIKPAPASNLKQGTESAQLSQGKDGMTDTDGKLPSAVVKVEETSVLQSQHYKLGDKVDVWENLTGGWYPGRIDKITHYTEAKNGGPSKSNDGNGMVNMFNTSGLPLKDASDGYTYHVRFEGYEEPTAFQFGGLRPVAYQKVTLGALKVGDTVLANYYVEEPEKRGYFYDATITKKNFRSRTCREVEATITVGNRDVVLENCKLMFLDEFYRIEMPVELSKRDPDLEYWMQVGKPPKREIKPDCEFCKDRKSVKCKQCSCRICGERDEPNKQLLCDECNGAFHIWCLNPPLEQLPGDEDWYCPDCKNDATEVVRAGEKLKDSKKKAKLASVTGTCTRDWGKGMACAGRTKQCTIVPSNHYGPIPGVEVGTMWIYRLQASEAGVHRPHVAGIHGRENDGAYSIVLAGGYPEDTDNGDEFFYTGSGGRDLSGNKRTAKQSSDQRLTRMNKALAINCNVPLNPETGACAEKWQKGKPVRVLRSSKGKKHSEYCPNDGIRYDGIYKVVKYWPATGSGGFIVWRYLLRRDDPAPSPWSKAGKRRIKELGLEMQYPEGYLESKADKHAIKRAEPGSPDSNSKRICEDNTAVGTPKRAKSIAYKIPREVENLIRLDVANKNLWADCLAHVNEGSQKFIAKVEEVFCCVCCQDVVRKPVTTVCNHNVCHGCLSRAFHLEMYNCPVCRCMFGKDYSLTVNKKLSEILRTLFPGYENQS